MPSSVPTESAIDKSMDPFGLGTYDYPESSKDEMGENSNKKQPGKSLPDAGGPLDPFGPDRLLSYPQSTSTASNRRRDRSEVLDLSEHSSSAMLPGQNLDYEEGGSHELFLNPTRPMSVSHSNLPVGNEPRAVADYYDRLSTTYDIFADHSGDTFASDSSEVTEKSSSDSLPSLPENSSKVDNYLGALGNYWSGYNVQDQNVDAGFPSDKYWDIGRYQQLNASEAKMNKLATNVPVVRGLTKVFLKDFGKKDLTRRHVMAFLTKASQPQYLASDIIRCLALDHNIFVRDVLDEFPVRTASNDNISRLASIRGILVDLEADHIRDPSASLEFRYAAAEITKSIAALERLGE